LASRSQQALSSRLFFNPLPALLWELPRRHNNHLPHQHKSRYVYRGRGWLFLSFSSSYLRARTWRRCGSIFSFTKAKQRALNQQETSAPHLPSATQRSLSPLPLLHFLAPLPPPSPLPPPLSRQLSAVARTARSSTASSLPLVTLGCLTTWPNHQTSEPVLMTAKVIRNSV
jgi:hypothetical protein